VRHNWEVTAIEFAKGHGTGNDFVIVPDLADERPLKPSTVAALCDRHRGVGGDGLLRVVPAESAGAEDGSPQWFMDYCNADGSIAEMCGNGIRVFARYLLEQGLASGPEIPIATRAGVKTVRAAGDGLTVDMGPALFGRASEATVDGAVYTGQAVSMGNPHLVCFLDDPADLDTLDLHRAPSFDRELFPDGVNVEFVQLDATPGRPRREGEAPHVRMRVHERGVGETLSCGTGACAVAAAVLRHTGDGTGRCRVDLPGGTLTMDVSDDTVLMTGPAVIVAHGTVRLPA
jgi:diaminopimelate epimerase